MKKTIRDYNLNEKKVIIRVDFNVPIKDGIITDDNRIVESLPTIKYAIENNAKVILMSHLGRVKEESDLAKNTLKPVADRLSELLNQKVIFINETRGQTLIDAIAKLQNKEVLLIENTRYEDLDGKKESSNNEELGKYWASLGDIFINDAFGTAHRAHASNVGISSHLPNGVGFLIEKELNVIGTALDNPNRPLTVILGGAKVSDKIGVIENLLKLADYILIGGGMSYTFLKAEDYNIGKSLLDSESIDFAKNILNTNKNKLILPIDVVTGEEFTNETSKRTCLINEIKDNEQGLDIGPKTIELFKEYINKSNTIIWNGPVGVFEFPSFAIGTKELFESMSNTNKITIIGGGDTASAAINMGYKEKFTHISTGGGASLEMLEGKILPGIACINEK